MSNKPLHRRLLTFLGIALVAVLIVGGSGYLYFKTIGSASAAEKRLTRALKRMRTSLADQYPHAIRKEVQQ